MRLSAVITAFLAAGAVASPVTSQGSAQLARRAEPQSLDDIASGFGSLKDLVNKSFSGSETPSAADIGSIQDRLKLLLSGLVPINLDKITDGDLLQLLNILDNLGDIVTGLTGALPTDGLGTRDLSYAPLIDVLYPLLDSVSDVVSKVLTAVYGAIGSQAAKDNSELTEKLLKSSSSLSSNTGSLFSLLGNLGNLGDLLSGGK